MLEVQIKDEKLFDRLKAHASYYSDVTKVLCLPDSFRSKIPVEYSVYQVMEDKPILKYEDGKIKIDPMTDEIRCYLGMFKNWQYSVSLNDMERLQSLVENDIFVVDGSFKAEFTRLPSNAKVKDLNVASKGYRTNGKTFKFSSIEDVKLVDLFRGITFTEKKVSTKEIKIVDFAKGTDRTSKERVEISFQCEDNNGNIVSKSAYVYKNIDPIMTLLNDSNEVNTLFDENDNIVTFLPKEMEVDSIKVYSQSKSSKKLAKLPVAMFRLAYAEYLIRGNK